MTNIQWKATHNGTKQLNAAIDAFCKKWEPKQIGSYEENGHTVRVFESAYGCNSEQRVR